MKDARTDSGFLTTDAIVGLAVLALGAAAVLIAGSTAMKASRAALQTRLALARADACLQADWTALPAGGVRRGRTADGVDWMLVSRPSPASPILCDVACTAALSRSRVTLRTMRLCAAEVAPHG